MQAIIKRNDPLYRQIVSYFEEEILQGRLKPGDRIPATTRLSEIFNVNPDTVQQSLKLLAERGFVSRAPGRGTFVRKGINSRTFGIIFKRTVLTDEDVSFYSGFLNDFILLAEQEQWNCRLFMVTENLSPEDASGEGTARPEESDRRRGSPRGGRILHQPHGAGLSADGVPGSGLALRRLHGQYCLYPQGGELSGGAGISRYRGLRLPSRPPEQFRSCRSGASTPSTPTTTKATG